MTDSPSPSPEQPGLTPPVLQILRFATLAMVLGLGLLMWFLAGEWEPGEQDESVASLMQILYLLVLGGAGVGVFVLRSRIQQPAPFRKRSALTIAGYALAEAPALFGAILLLFTGSVLPYLVGVLLLLMAFVVLPIPPQDEQ